MGKKHKCKKTECPAGEKWAVPTADFFSLLLALFIALYAIASTNKEKMKAVKEEFVKIYDFAPVPETVTPVVDMVSESTPSPENSSSSSAAIPTSGGGSILTDSSSDASTAKTIADVIENIEKELKSASLNNGPLEQAIDGVVLKLPAFVPFNKADASINNKDTELFIKRIGDIINMLPLNVNISIRGYTDNQPLPKDSPFKDSIELSYHRAYTVMRELVKNGVAAERLSVAGYGSVNPIVQNDTEENRAKNRRVEFYMFISNDAPLDKTKQKNILDALSELKK